MEEADSLPSGGMLTSWKEIASFFHRDVRTVQRWEREQGLPVHRHRHQRGSSVFAYSHELEQWWKHYEDRDSGEASTNGPGPSADLDLPDAIRPGPAANRGTTLRWSIIGALVLAATLTAASLFPSGKQALSSFPRSDLAVISTPEPVEVRSMSDLNGDGRADAVVSRQGAGEAWIFLGSSQPVLRSRADVRIVDERGPGFIGVGAVGDVDGDGITDLVVSLYLTEPATYDRTGPSYLLRGRRTWPDTVRLPADADTEFYLDYRGDIRMGACTTSNGVDLNADGIHDILLGGADYSPPGRASAGGAFIFFGRRAWPEKVEVVSAADVAIHGSRSGEALNYECTAGDFTGDGRPDLALNAHESTLWFLLGGRGRVYVFEGRQEWPRIIDAARDVRLTLTGSTPQGSFAPPLVTDVNGDSVADLVVAVSDPEKRGNGGRLAIVFGGRERRGTLAENQADVLVQGSRTFGQDVAGIDLNLDGMTDLVMNEPETGITRLILGRREFVPRGGLEKYASARLASVGRGSASIGIAEGDFDGDGITDIALETVSTSNGVKTRRLSLVTAALPIGVDVRPNSTPNVLVPGGIVAVAVSEGPLAGELDVGSLRFAGSPPSRVAREDFNGDGRADLRLYFDVARLSVAPGTTRLAVRGRTRDGLPVAGADNVILANTPSSTLDNGGSKPRSPHDK